MLDFLFSNDTGTSDAVSAHLRTISYFNFHTLEKATKNFHSNNLLGCGGFGPVFLVRLMRLTNFKNPLDAEFKNWH